MGKKLEEKKLGDEKGSDSPDSSTKVGEVKEDQKAAAVQRLLMKKVKEAKEKEAREAEEKKRKEEEKKKRVGGDVQADRERKKNWNYLGCLITSHSRWGRRRREK